MPRLRIRRLLLFLSIVTGCALLALNLAPSSREAGYASVKFSDENFFPGLAEVVRRRPKFEGQILSLSQQSSAGSSNPSVSSSLQNTRPLSSSSNKPIPFESSISMLKEKPWFMSDGTYRPDVGQPNPKPPVWPDQVRGDRIVEQLMFVPANYSSNWNFSSPTKSVQSSSAYQREKLKKILLYFGKGGWNDLPLGRTVFLRDKCPVNTCELTTALREAEHADALFFKDRFLWPFYKRSPNQVWILFLLECPLHTQAFKNLKNVFNWTATYRHDSDLVAPYEKFVPYPRGYLKRNGLALENVHNFAANKTKKVAWFVSNCNARNKRLEYAKELARHIEVDIYGSCGNKRCPRTLTKKCFKMLDRDYKFYLAFENSNCKDYITEKFFINGLSRDIVPIVMGARPEDYERAAPHHSYIHVDDFASPKELAAYLHVLDKNDTLYNEYFKWKGTGEFINTYFWCRMCALLHAPLYHKSYSDMHQWWSGAGTCNAGHWRRSVQDIGAADDSAEEDNDDTLIQKAAAASSQDERRR